MKQKKRNNGRNPIFSVHLFEKFPAINFARGKNFFSKQVLWLFSRPPRLEAGWGWVGEGFFFRRNGAKIKWTH